MRMTFSTPVTPTRESETSTAGRWDWTSGAEITTGGAGMEKLGERPQGARAGRDRFFAITHEGRLEASPSSSEGHKAQPPRGPRRGCTAAGGTNSPPGRARPE